MSSDSNFIYLFETIFEGFCRYFPEYDNKINEFLSKAY